jgi:hypothetical protein
MVAWFAVSAWAGPIKDPAAQIDAGSFSHSFSGLGSFSPCGDLDPITDQCTGLIGLYNDTGGFLTSITLDTTINVGLDQTLIDSSFTCNSDPFFLQCGITYTSSSGALSISFFGVLPPDMAAVDGQDGIPPLLPGCIDHPDAPGCNVVGHFTFDFLSLEGLNGWTDGNTTLFPGGETPEFAPPVFTDTATPEPGTSALLAAGLFSLALLSRRNYSSRSSRS